MITEDYVSFEVAKLLKEKGFNEKPISSINYFKGSMYPIDGVVRTMTEDISIPLQSIATKWLREVYNIHIYTFYANGWIFTILDLETREEFTRQQGYSSEEAVEAALKYCLTKLI